MTAGHGLSPFRPTAPVPSTPRALLGGSSVVLLALLLSACSSGGAPAGGPGESAGAGEALSAVAKARIEGGYGRLPLSFERNVGQFDRRMRFVARGSGYAVGFSSRGPVMSLSRDRPGRRGVLRLDLDGARRGVPVRGVGEQPGRVNHLVGRDPAKWRTNVATYDRVRYQGAYPGIDATFYGNQRELEYDFDVAPGADPSVIAMRLRGARSVRIDRHGDLVVRMDGGTVRQLAPVSHQVVGGRRRSVPSRFAIDAHGRVGFRLGRYDRRRALTIDPVLVYSTYLGGSGSDNGRAVAVDGSGAAYVAGYTSSSAFPSTGGAAQTGYGGGGLDAFVTKLSPDGASRVYSTYLGGPNDDAAHAVAVDASGAAYVVGVTNASGFPTTAGAAQTSTGGGTDAFVTKLSATGASRVYSTYVGGPAPTSASASPSTDPARPT